MIERRPNSIQSSPRSHDNVQETGLSYVLNTPDQQRAMLDKIGVESIQQLFASIPASLRLKRPLNVPPSLTEMELTRHMQELAGANLGPDRCVCFLGGG